MNALRRNVLKGAAGAGTVAVAVAAGLLKPNLAMAVAPRSAFEAKNVGDAMSAMGAGSPADSKDITVKAPDIAENGAVVPVEVTSAIAGTTSIAIIAEKNVTSRRTVETQPGHGRCTPQRVRSQERGRRHERHGRRFTC